MKLIYSCSVILLVFSSCTSQVNSCNNSDVESFNNFLGFNSESTEEDLYENLGIPSDKNYNEDSTKVIYGYLFKPDVPIAVVVNSYNKKVESVLMEILTFDKEFETDLKEAEHFYKLDSCDTRFFGLTENQIKAGFEGDPQRKTENGGIILLEYCSSDYKTCITFKLYPEQGSVCSTVIFNWNH